MSAASTQGLSTASRPSVDPKGSPSCRPHRSPRATRAVLGVALLVPLTAAGCEVSVFGGAPVSLLGGGSVESGGEARACSEPDDARAARTAPGGCEDRCTIDVVAGTTDCEEVTLGAPHDGTARLDLHAADGLSMTLEICGPTGTVFELSDAAAPARSAHDATIALEGTTLRVDGTEGSGVETSRVTGWIPATGCVERTLVVADQLVYLVENDVGLCGPALLRLMPPSDAEGTPDALWHLALAGRVDGTASGGGLRRASLCFW